MASINKCIFIGNCTKAPELKYLPSGEALVNLTIACNDSWKDKNSGEKKESVEYINITFFQKLAEIVSAYVKKGDPIYVEGKMTTRKYTDSNGVEKYATSIKADTMQMLGSKPQDAPQQDDTPAPKQSAPAPHQSRQQANNQRAAPNFSDMDDDIPFLFNMNTVCDTMGISKQKLRSKYGKGLSILQVNQGEF